MRLLPDNEYHFLTHWFAPGATTEEVFAVIADVEALPTWWPAVYRDVRKVETPKGSEPAYDLTTKGWLPYLLRWRLTVREVTPPHGSAIGASGDFDGRGIWRFEQTADGVAITFDWKLLAEKPLLRYLSPLLKPIFSFNHRWAMATGEVSLLRELERRARASSAGNASSVPAPPAPTTWQPYAATAAAMAAVILVGVLIRDDARGRWRGSGRR